MSSWTKYIVCIPTYIGEVARDWEREKGLLAEGQALHVWDHTTMQSIEKMVFFVQHAIAIFGIGCV